MHWNHFLNRIRISGLKVFIVSLVFILILALALILRTFTGKTEVDAYHFVAEINQALASGNPKAMEPYIQDTTRWNEQLAADLTAFESELQALTFQEVRLHVTDHKTDRLRNQMDLKVGVEAPDLSLLGRNWLKDAKTQEEVLDAYSTAIKELPQAETEDLELLVDDVLAHVGSRARVVEVNKFADALTKSFRSELGDLRPLLVDYNDQVSLAKPSKPTTPKDAAGPEPLDDDALSQDEDLEIEPTTVEPTTTEPTEELPEETTPENTFIETTTEETTTRPTTRPTTARPTTTRPTTIPSTTLPTAARTTPPTTAPTNPPTVTTIPTTTPTTRVFSTTAPTTRPSPTTMPTTTPVPTTVPAPQYPQIGQYYTVSSMNEDLVQIARQVYSGYANPEDYVYLIIEYNGLQIVNGEVVLYYGQTIYLPVP